MLRVQYWHDGILRMLDQRLLPYQESWLDLQTWQDVREAIKDMAVRGAPAIGISAAYGMALAAGAGESLDVAAAELASSRPTAVNLFWALDRIKALPEKSFHTILAEAHRIEQEDIACNEKIGENGAALFPESARVLTICNTGSLATGGHGTALGIIRTAHAQGKVKHVYSCETRPRLQGLRLTAYELLHDGIPFESIVDSAAASLMHARKVDCVVTGADRITANGDTANKIGTYMLAVCARHHGIPFYVAAPWTTFDPSLASGDLIEIEERDGREITHFDEKQIAPEGCPTLNPAFDVTPGDLIDAIISDRGVHRPPYLFTSQS